MFWLIESIEQLENLQRLSYKEAFIEVVGIDHTKHPKENSISILYIHPKLSEKGYIIALNHSESFSIPYKNVLEFLKTYDVLYTIDKKHMLHYFLLKNIWDVILPPNHIDIKNTKTHDNFYRLNYGKPNLNYILPLSKHYESLNAIYNEVKDKCYKSQTEYAKFFNNKTSIVFNFIESSGIQVNKELFEEYFHKLEGDYIYTRYNLKTTTTRPSNSFKGVNYAALNKNNGCRSSIIPRNDMLIEFDISAYHPSLVAKLIKYDFKGENIHTYFSKLYGVSYDKAKELTFKQIYGNIFKQYSDLDFFVKLKHFINKMWEEFETQGYYECSISHYRYYKNNLDDMNPSKLLNYVLQNLETSNNVLILWDLIRIFNGKKSKLILYTYDSFLFDFDRDESNLLVKIENIFKKYGFQYKFTSGKNYNFK